VLTSTTLGKEAWRVTKARILHQCHEIVFGELRALSFTGFRCIDAVGQERLVFPAIHSYLGDTPEAHKLASVMGWPAACANCGMPRAAAGRTLDDIVRAGRWPMRTPQQSQDLYDEATEVGNAAAEAHRDDPAARLRAATKFCEERGYRWAPSVLWRAPTCPALFAPQRLRAPCAGLRTRSPPLPPPSLPRACGARRAVTDAARRRRR
jgi:hypothetical protein